MILNWLLSLGSGALLVLLFPRFSFIWLAPVALTPLLIACARERRWHWRFGYGYAAGLIYWAGLCPWIQWTLEHHAGVSGATAWVLFVLFCLAKAVQLGAFAALAGLLMHRLLTLLAVPALWVCIEWTHAWTGFQWLTLGNAGSDMSLLLRLAPVTGVWGLSFAFALMSSVVAAIALRKPRGASLLLLPLLLLLAIPSIPAPQRGTASAAIVQPNFDDDTLWSPELLRQTEDRMKMLSLVTGHSDVIVWPEVPAPFYDYDPQFTELLSSTARSANAGLLAGVVSRNAKGPLNSAVLISPQGSRTSRYDKVNLVPFGEFVPWPFSAVTQKISTEAGDFLPGHDVTVSLLGTHKVGSFICYESVFPGYVRQFANSGAEVLFNLSNDSWFGKTQARYQHVQIVRMRAAENARWIVRGTNNGVSGSIDPAGRLLRTLPEYQEVVGRMGYGYSTRVTFYTRLGDWFVILCALMATAGLLYRKVSRQ